MTGSMGWLERPGGRLAYEVRGEGRPVVCIPAIGDIRGVYAPLADRLAAHGFRVVLLDPRGQGQSDASFGTYSAQDTAEDVLALIGHAAVGGRAAVVGHAGGATAALLAAAMAPAKIAALVLVSPTVRRQSSAGERLAQAVGLLRPWGPRLWLGYYRSLTPIKLRRQFRSHYQSVRAALRRQGHWAALVGALRDPAPDLQPRLHNLRVRTLVVMGVQDRDVRRPVVEARALAQQLHGHIVLVPEAGHVPHAESPEVVAPEVIRFLGRVKWGQSG
jgi:pimeloyl-ACP methyl ester carboxylesterase